MALEELLTKKEVAEKIQQTPRTIEHLMARGLPFIKLGKKCVRFRPSDVAAFLEKHTRKVA
jgi:hypothetical protein